eukprot:TRINITY_DN1080_c0_g1_i1.p1 TRINITY_DN1080_c0_g1~~TRINITY_DN1080_c0_g1_i1.p1  ORF type:complete len:462 (-),score=150.20 TRINITY_DN1080_c0_g1_i1:501-1886(-)
MGSSEEAFCLKWNDFQKSVTSSFAELRRDSNLTDVTIVVEGTQLKAHKVILSACSGAFKELFRSGISKEPVIMLWDVSAEDMEALFNFMYQGQVNVAQERLNTFLDLAERLRVKGLTNKPQDEPEKSEASSNGPPSHTPGMLSGERKRLPGISPSNSGGKKQRKELLSESDSEDKSEKITIKQEGLKLSSEAGDNERTEELEEDYNNEDYFEPEGDSFTATGARAEEDNNSSSHLQGTSTHRDFPNAESNKESRHENCSWCNRSFRNLNQHIDDIHLATPTPCPICGKVFSSKPKMLKHKTLKHHGESRGSSGVVPPGNPLLLPASSNCPYCGKFFDSRQGMNGHTAHCSLRPKSLISPKNEGNINHHGGSSTPSNNMGSGITVAVCPDCGRLFQSKHQMYGHRAHCKARVPSSVPKKSIPLPNKPLPVHQALAGENNGSSNSNSEEGFELLDKGNMIWVE